MTRAMHPLRSCDREAPESLMLSSLAFDVVLYIHFSQQHPSTSVHRHQLTPMGLATVLMPKLRSLKVRDMIQLSLNGR